MGCRLHLKCLNTLLWSPKPKFKIWIRSDKWLMSYNPRRVGGWVDGWGGGSGVVGQLGGRVVGWSSQII
jgi:hypothetical protein